MNHRYLHLIKFQKLARNVESVTVVPALLVARHGDTRHGHVSAAGRVSRVRLLAPRPVEDADARPEVLPRLLPVLLDAQVVDDGRAAAHHQDVNLGVKFLFYIATVGKGILLLQLSHIINRKDIC